MAQIYQSWMDNPTLGQFMHDQGGEAAIGYIADAALLENATSATNVNTVVFTLVEDALNTNHLRAAEHFMRYASQNDRQWALMHGEIASQFYMRGMVTSADRHLSDIECEGASETLISFVFVKCLIALLMNTHNPLITQKMIDNFYPKGLPESGLVKLTLDFFDEGEQLNVLSALYDQLEEEVDAENQHPLPVIPENEPLL